MPRFLSLLFLFALFAGLGCRQCGERTYLFPRLRERLSGDDDDSKQSSAERSGSAKDCCPDGRPVSRSGAGFAGETLSYPGGTVYPSYPSGPPYSPPSNELPPPGSYIPSPGVPYPSAQPHPVDSSRFLPKSGGTMTGDAKK